MTDEVTPTPEQPEAQTPEAREEADIRAAAETNPEKFEKFGGVDAFLKSYQDLRADHTKKSQELSELKNSEPAAEEQQEAAPADAPDSLEIPENVTEYTEDEAAEMWDEWGQELRSSGNLSDDTRSTIREKLGIPEEVINAYVKGLQAQAQTRAAEASELVGGAGELQEIIQWASKTLPDAERLQINAALDGPGWETTLLGLKARRDSTNPTKGEPRTGVVGQPASAPTIKPFYSQAEMNEAIRDPRYNTNKDGYRDQVIQRIAATRGRR